VLSGELVVIECCRHGVIAGDMGEKTGRAMHDFNPVGSFYPLMHLGRMQSPNHSITTAYLLRQRYPPSMHASPLQAPLNAIDPLVWRRIKRMLASGVPSGAFAG
jgi:hypothetical protein